MSTKLICYLSFGYPTIEKSIEMTDIYIDAGCDMIEVDLPTDNPFLDSDFIGGRMKAALDNCDDYDKYLEGIANIREKYPDLPMIVLSYEHTLKKIGVDKFIEHCKKNNTLDIILVGLEGEEIKEKLIKNGLKVSCYVQFHLPDEEIESALNSNGFVYMQSKVNDKVKEGFETLKDCIGHLRDRGVKNPIYCGVGISTKDDIVRVRESGGDAAFVGSAILKKQDNIQEMKEFIKELKSAAL